MQLLRSQQHERWRASLWYTLCLVAFLIVPWPAAAIQVVATTTDVAAIVQAVGGERVEVKILAKGYFDPHHLEAKPSYMAALRKADMLAYNGLQLEVGWLPLVIDGSRNRAIAPGAPGHLALSTGIRVLEVPEGEISRAEGDIHPEGNPHYTLDPRNLLIMATNVENALKRNDPEGSAVYERNHRQFAERLESAIVEWQGRLARYRGREVICYHKQWEYLLDWLGIIPADYIERKPGIPPSARHIEFIEQLIRDRKVQVAMTSTYTNMKPMQHLAEQTGVRVLTLPAAVGAISGVDDPFALFDYLTRELAAAFAGASAP